MSSTTGLLAYCRQGFEPELAAELTERAALAGFAGYARAQRNDGHVVFVCEQAEALDRALPAELRGIDPKDRITPILAALSGAGRYGDLWVEHPDSDSAKPLAGLARSFGNALRPALRKAGFLTEKDDARLPRLHVVFVQGDHLFLCVAHTRDSAPWALGIPRLKLLPDAPSRSALKLEEAFLSLLD
ncbi:MAG: 23S rRNA (cytidine(2498)-2'-O)-methyltransferase RlmM, partial [Stenotrophomonas acidaminiphila]